LSFCLLQQMSFLLMNAWCCCICQQVVKNVNVFVCVVCCEILNIFTFIVLFQRSTTDDCSAFSVKFNTQYFHIFITKFSPFVCPKLLWSSRLKISFDAFKTGTQALSFNGSIQPYFENTSITVRRYLTPRLNLENDCMSTRSAAQILSIPFTYTFHFQNFLTTGL